MNKTKLITSSGDVVIFDERGRPKEVENSNNLDQILIKENKIETIENRTKELEEELSEYPASEEVNQNKFIPLFTIMSLIASLIWPLVDSLLRGNLTIFTSTYNTFFSIYKEILSTSLVSTLVLATSILGICFDIVVFIENKKFKQNYNANDSELETLRRILPEEKEKLRQLNSEKKLLPKENKAKYGYNMSMEQINDQKYLNELNDYLEFYRLVGIALPKLYKLYLDGTLDKFFEENGYEFSKEEYEILINYIKEKGPSTNSKKVRKKSRSKNNDNRQN